MKKIKISFFCALAVWILSCNETQEESVLPYYNSPDFTPYWKLSDIKEKHPIAPFHFVNQNGDAVTNATVRGKIYAVNFFFTSCAGICLNMTTNFQKVHTTFKNDTSVVLISHSVTPWKDSVAVLKEYANRYGISTPGWHLVTGTTKEIYQLARESYFAEEEPGFSRDSTEFLHTEHVLLLDKKGYIRGLYNGTLPLDIDRMIQDIYVLKNKGIK